VGLWELKNAEGEESDWLGFDGFDLTVLRSCGEVSWRTAATRGLLVTGIAGGSQSCFRAAGESGLEIDDDWGQSLAAYRPAGDGWELLDDDGVVVGSLTAPADIPSEVSELGLDTLPFQDERMFEALRDPAPIPSPWTAATTDQLLGTWATVGDEQQPPATISFRADDYVIADCYTMADGRDPGRARGDDWNGDGELFVAPPVVALASTCGGPSLPFDASSIRSIAYDAGELVLFDGASSELARLERVAR
jgi:hypothetical protein